MTDLNVPGSKFMAYFRALSKIRHPVTKSAIAIMQNVFVRSQPSTQD